MIDFLKLLVLAGEEWPAGNDLEACFLTPGNGLTCRLSLHNHAADKHQISPFQVFLS
jgi:hypothetical protein